MKVQIHNSGRAGGGEVIRPDDPVPPIDPDDFFVVETFETDDPEALPFSEVTVRWQIEPRDAETRFEDFEFRLVAPPQFVVDGISAEGAHSFPLLRATSLRLEGRKNGSRWMPLGQQITVSVDESDCRRFIVTGAMIDPEVSARLDQITSETAQLRLRGDLSADWNTDRIRYYFPLELVTPNFFNADLDLWMDIRFVVTHFEDDEGEKTEVDVRVDFDEDVDYSLAEDILSLGFSAGIAEKAIEYFVPMVLECHEQLIELMLVEQLLENDLVAGRLETDRLFDVRIVPAPQNYSKRIEVLTCAVPPDTGGPSADDSSEPVVTRGVSGRRT
jgi:hypothetical protein